jgi:hypothetical protein
LPRFPDFFVVGAPRCGTTSFCRYLARNPQICFSQPKEPHYFTQLTRDPTEVELARDYLERCFGHCTPAHRAIGEGSVSYLYLPAAIERIRRINPEARFIALVRNPLTMLPSYHLRMRFLLQEDEPDFARAWALEPARARGENVPRHCLDPRLLLYSKVAQLGAQVQTLFEIAGPRALARRGIRRPCRESARRLSQCPRISSTSTTTARRVSSRGTRAGCTGIAGCSASCSCRRRKAAG